MDETEIVLIVSGLGPYSVLFEKCEDVVILQEKLCNSDITNARGNFRMKMKAKESMSRAISEV